MIREMQERDLDGLLELYMQLHDNEKPKPSKNLNKLWKQMIEDKNYHIVVAIEDEKIVSTCVLVIIPNLTHQQRPYALIENVVTDINYRKKGLATACLEYAKEVAITKNCYKIMLLTGAKDESTLRFYETAGFNQNDKTAFIQWL
ncbi:GNAT family N-acetyltransferase [Candidatus Galacturonibacter soehngenii]|uniref:GNAT family N-acetyltransferase n=1 Tax=Candidatus Galacturonatibacter soehngenii TaxID=2307010 RepID=A0A7V7QID4_9FIRM|nr:GNAT family N-acetyltransferase [Candidatus Galacturonibacter soehngenii]KAB1434497.1 GNAT family N-acetyltransferase [Candidatus Galacturonibacter soehngenii]MBA4688920.1 GNAT family N-acetyltransferase [Candidatus Galacturonibacter soehngenii]